MSNDQQQYLKTLRHKHDQRLRVLEQRAAQLGINAPADTLIEIEEIRTTISGIDNQLLQEADDSITLDTDKQLRENSSEKSNSSIIGSTEAPFDKSKRLFEVQEETREFRLFGIVIWSVSVTQRKRTYRLFGVPIWSVSILATRSTFVILYLSGIIVTFSLGLALGYQGQISNTTPDINVPIAVDATKDWQSTGVFARKGERVSIRVVGGKWTAYRERLPDEIRKQLPKDLQDREIWQNVWSENTGDGIGVKCIEFSPPKPDNPCPVPTFYASGLVAKIGTTAAPFGVGNILLDFPAPDDGIIYLRINDGQSQGIKYLDDNAGVLAVEISIKH